MDNLVLDYRNCKSDNEYNQPKNSLALDERSEDFKAFYQVAVTCLSKANCTMQTPGFQQKFAELIEISKGQEIKLQKNYEPKCYVKNGKIDYKKMIIDELLLVEYYSLNLAREFVSKLFMITLHFF